MHEVSYQQLYMPFKNFSEIFCSCTFLVNHIREMRPIHPDHAGQEIDDCHWVVDINCWEPKTRNKFQTRKEV